MIKLFCILNAFNRFEQKREKTSNPLPTGDSQDYQSFDFFPLCIDLHRCIFFRFVFRIVLNVIIIRRRRIITLFIEDLDNRIRGPLIKDISSTSAMPHNALSLSLSLSYTHFLTQASPYPQKSICACLQTYSRTLLYHCNSLV